MTKPGCCRVCGYNLAHLPEPRCPECGKPFNPEDLRRELPWNAGPDWGSPDTSDIPEGEFPINCSECAQSLAGLGDEGHCPKCGAPFSRCERLVELHGPEVFLPDLRGQVRPTRPTRGIVMAIVMTAVALVAAPVVHSLWREGYVPAESRSFLVLLFIVAAVEWYRVVRESL